MSKPGPSLVLALVLVSGLIACDAPGEPDPVLDIAPIQIDGVDVALLESFPVRATALVTGVIGDGCSELLPIEQNRDGAEIEVTIRRSRPRDAVCTQIAKLFEDTIALDGTFAPGDYTLSVNDVTVRFHVD